MENKFADAILNQLIAGKPCSLIDISPNYTQTIDRRSIGNYHNSFNGNIAYYKEDDNLVSIEIIGPALLAANSINTSLINHELRKYNLSNNIGFNKTYTSINSNKNLTTVVGLRILQDAGKIIYANLPNYDGKVNFYTLNNKTKLNGTSYEYYDIMIDSVSLVGVKTQKNELEDNFFYYLSEKLNSILSVVIDKNDYDMCCIFAIFTIFDFDSCQNILRTCTNSLSLILNKLNFKLNYSFAAVVVQIVTDTENGTNTDCDPKFYLGLGDAEVDYLIKNNKTVYTTELCLDKNTNSYLFFQCNKTNLTVKNMQRLRIYAEKAVYKLIDNIELLCASSNCIIV